MKNSNFRPIFLYSLCWPQPSAAMYVPAGAEWQARKQLLWHIPLNKTWASAGPSLKREEWFWLLKPWSRSLWRWPSAGCSCASFHGHPCSAQFSASFITLGLSCEVIGCILYLAANLSLTYNMQVLFIRCWLCSCGLFLGPQPILLDWGYLGVKD